MSHFTVAVFTKKGDNPDRLLAPYQENNMGDCPEQYMEFIDTEQENLEQYENDSFERIKGPDGKLYTSWDKKFEVKDPLNPFRSERVIPEEYETIEIPLKELYPTFEEFMKEYHGCKERDAETGKYGYWENPNAKWDWYQTGGRFSGILKLKGSGEGTNIAKVGEIDWEAMSKESREHAEKTWDSNPQGIERYFAGIEENDTRESYIRKCSEFCTYAVITSDGRWHGKGEMGWWGISSETPDEAEKWNESFHDMFIKNTDPDETITIVDCHI